MGGQVVLACLPTEETLQPIEEVVHSVGRPVVVGVVVAMWTSLRAFKWPPLYQNKQQSNGGRRRREGV